jgi:hypothetical protein
MFLIVFFVILSILTYSYVMAALFSTVGIAGLAYMYYGPNWHENDDMAKSI